MVMVTSTPLFPASAGVPRRSDVVGGAPDKLNAVLDAWVDVQRRWLYLEGIFFASRDIKQQLPSEFAVRMIMI